MRTNRTPDYPETPNNLSRVELDISPISGFFGRIADCICLVF